MEDHVRMCKVLYVCVDERTGFGRAAGLEPLRATRSPQEFIRFFCFQLYSSAIIVVFVEKKPKYLFFLGHDPIFMAWSQSTATAESVLSQIPHNGL